MKLECSKSNRKGIRVTQDSVHLGNKLKHRLEHAQTLKMGSKSVKYQDLVSLVISQQKSVHGLSQSDVKPTDKMDSKPFQKIISDRVLNALLFHIKNFEATVQYLRMCSDVTSCFLELDCEPLERLLRISRGCFFYAFGVGI